MRQGSVNRGRRGLTLLEVSLSLVVVALLLLAALASFSTNLRAVQQAKTTTSGGLFLEAVLESLAAQSYDGVLAMNGNRFYDDADLDRARFATDLTAFTFSLGILQVELTLVELNSGRTLGRATTLRTRP